MKPLLERNYVIVHLVVQESEAKKSRETPGGLEQMEALGGKGAGLPFMAVLDPKGKMLINSLGANPKGGPNSNIGYPAAPHEIAHFMKMLGLSAQHLSATETSQIETWLKEHAPKV